MKKVHILHFIGESGSSETCADAGPHRNPISNMLVELWSSHDL